MSLFAELKRRNVFKVAAAYMIVGWLILQVGEVLSPALHLPEWSNSILAFFIILGFPLALIFAWAFEITPEGLKKERDIDRTQSITQVTGQKLNYTIIALLVLALGYFAADKFLLHPEHEESAQVTEPGVKSIAVLPLADMSAEGDNEYFADGLSEELLNILARNENLRVAGRTSSFAFKGRNEDLREIGEKLDVETILEGSVRKDDARNRVRITLQLINTEDGYHVWSETYDRDLDDIFAIQEEVAEQVASALRVKLLGEEAAPEAQVVKTDIGAYDLYLRGLQGLNQFSYGSLQQAEDDFQQALALDPEYLPAQLGLIDSWKLQANTGVISYKEAVDRSSPLLRRILQLHPENSEAHRLMAWAHRRDRDWSAAERDYRAALEHDPRNVDAMAEFGSFLRDRERIDEGLPHLLRAAQLDPYSTAVQWDLCWSHMWMADLQAALSACAKIREVDPQAPGGYYGPSQAYWIAGDLASALQWDKRATEVDPDDYELKAEVGDLWLDLGDASQAKAWVEKAYEAGGANQVTPMAARVNLLLHDEQLTAAATLAATALQRESRRWSKDVLRNAFILDAIKRGDLDAAIESFRSSNPELFEEPMRIDMDTVSWGVDNLVEMAYLIKQKDFASPQADQLLDAAESIIDGADPKLVSWLADVNRAGLLTVRGEKEQAIALLTKAVDEGFRYMWRFRLQHWFVLEPLHGEPEYQALISRIETDMDRQREQAYALLGVGP